jgi:hypothetical protein
MLRIEDSRNSDVLDSFQDWRGAVDALLEFWSAEGRPYSSGEVAAALRIHRPDLAFQVPTLGSYLRDKFYSNTLPQYPDDGEGNGPCSPYQRSRFTAGKYPDRTPEGTEVFVYGPSLESCDGHDFEVFVPKWNGTRMETMADAPAAATDASTAPGSPEYAVAQTAYVKTIIAGAPSKLRDTDYVAYVKQEPDREPRMALGRPIFEALCHMNGSAIRAGQPVFVKVTHDVAVVITLTDPGDGAKPCNLSTSEGRLHFSSGDKLKPFPCGKHFKVAVSPSAITIDLSQAL